MRSNPWPISQEPRDQPAAADDCWHLAKSKCILQSWVPGSWYTSEMSGRGGRGTGDRGNRSGGCDFAGAAGGTLARTCLGGRCLHWPAMGKFRGKRYVRRARWTGPAENRKPNERMNTHHYRRSTCRLCAAGDLELVVPITPTPIADAYVAPRTPCGRFRMLSLDLYQCRSCGTSSYWTW